MPLQGVLHRAGVDLSVRHVHLAGAADPRSAGDRHPEVGVLGHDAYAALALQPGAYLVLLLLRLAPLAHRVLPVEQAGRVAEVLVLAQGHVRLLRTRLGGELGAAPADLLALLPLQHQPLHRLPAPVHQLHAFRVDVAQVSRVAVPPDGEVGLRRLHRPMVGWGGCDQLLVRCVAQKRLVAMLVLDHQLREASKPDDPVVEGPEQRQGGDVSRVAGPGPPVSPPANTRRAMWQASRPYGSIDPLPPLSSILKVATRLYGPRPDCWAQ